MNAYVLKLGIPLVAALNFLSSHVAVAASPVQITVGTSHAVVVKSDGSVWGWGDNTYGQLGNATEYDTGIPVAPPVPADIPNANAKGQAANCYTTYILKTDGTTAEGTVWSYGENLNFGLLGDRTSDLSTPPVPQTRTPVQVLINATKSPLTKVIAITAFSDHAMALRSDGTVWAWGNGRNGQLGDGTTKIRTAAVQVLVARGTPLTNVKAIMAGNIISYAIKNDGTVWAWGLNHHAGLGVSYTSLSESAYAVRVPGLTNVRAIAPGTQHYVALKNDGTMWAWGENNEGQLGDGSSITAPTRVTPAQVPVPPNTNITKIVTHWSHTLALTSTGSVLAWGPNVDGQLGTGVLTTRETTPVAVSGLTGAVEIAASTDYSFAITQSGQVFGWGSNDDGELGLDTATYPYSAYPIQVPGI